MATVNVEVNGRSFAVGCADGQEERVRQLAADFDAQVAEIAGQLGQVGDSRLFLMASLIMADELQDVKSKLAKRPNTPAAAPAARAPAPNNDGVAEALNAVAARIEKIAQNL